MHVKLIKGELRKITYKVKSKTDRNFVIEECKVELAHNEEIILELPTSINGHEVEFIIDTSNLLHYYYTLVITFKINEEIVKKKVSLEVVSGV